MIYHFQALLSPIWISQSMATNGSLPGTANIAPLGSLFCLQQNPDDNLELSDIYFENIHSNHSPFGKHTNQYHALPGYGYSP
jgi:hypothetical protein